MGRDWCICMVWSTPLLDAGFVYDGCLASNLTSLLLSVIKVLSPLTAPFPSIYAVFVCPGPSVLFPYIVLLTFVDLHYIIRLVHNHRGEG